MKKEMKGEITKCYVLWNSFYTWYLENFALANLVCDFLLRFDIGRRLVAKILGDLWRLLMTDFALSIFCPRFCCSSSDKNDGSWNVYKIMKHVYYTRNQYLTKTSWHPWLSLNQNEMEAFLLLTLLAKHMNER